VRHFSSLSVSRRHRVLCTHAWKRSWPSRAFRRWRSQPGLLLSLSLFLSRLFSLSLAVTSCRMAVGSIAATTFHGSTQAPPCASLPRPPLPMPISLSHPLVCTASPQLVLQPPQQPKHPTQQSPPAQLHSAMKFATSSQSPPNSSCSWAHLLRAHLLNLLESSLSTAIGHVRCFCHGGSP
jgi:hypothetical protein